MKLINRRKSRLQQVTDLAKDTLKTVTKAVEGSAAYKAGRSLVKRTPATRAVPIVLAAGGATAVVTRKLRSSGRTEPQQATPPPATSATVPG